MAVTASGLYVLSFRDALGVAQLAVDLDSETQEKVAMYTNSLVAPNFTTDTAYSAAPYTSNQVTGTNYTAGGVVLTSTTLTASSGSLVYDTADASWAASTIANARAALIYADGLAGKNAICLVDFTADYSTNNGTFTIQWNASGIFAIDLTP